MNTIFFRKGGLLERYKSSIVMGFSYYKLFASSRLCVRVRRSSDNTQRDFGFIGNYIDVAGILSFCGSGSGYVVNWYNQFSGGNHAVQNTNGNQARIVISGIFAVDGIDFLNTSQNRYDIGLYPQSSIFNPPMSLYANVFLNNASFIPGFIIISSRSLTANDPVLGLYAQGNASYSMHYCINNYGSVGTCVPPLYEKLMYSHDGINRHVRSLAFSNVQINSSSIATYDTYYQWTIGAIKTSAGYEAGYYFKGNIKTILLFNKELIGEYNKLKGLV